VDLPSFLVRTGGGDVRSVRLAAIVAMGLAPEPRMSQSCHLSVGDL
jgi:hypothetical protein